MSSRADRLAVELQTVAFDAARLGQDILLSGTRSHTAVTKGVPGNVVTEADRAIEHRLRAFLEESRPGDRLVGEELPDSGSDRTGIEWYIDPIDGTSNFVHGLDLFCTSVAAYDRTEGIWLAGAVTVPATGVAYVAAARMGSRKILSDGTVLDLDATVPAGTPRLLGVGFSYDPEVRARQLDDIRTLMRAFDDMRSLGTAALALCLVAEGVLASFVETDLFVYDWAAGALIAEEAGALVSRPERMCRGPVSAHGRS